jgi:hypothetical protein
MKLDRNYFNARAMLAVLVIKVANARALLATRVTNCSRPKIINVYLQLISPDLTTDHERLIICKKDRDEQSWKAAPGLPQT